MHSSGTADSKHGGDRDDSLSWTACTATMGEMESVWV